MIAGLGWLGGQFGTWRAREGERGLRSDPFFGLVLRCRLLVCRPWLSVPPAAGFS